MGISQQQEVDDLSEDNFIHVGETEIEINTDADADAGVNGQSGDISVGESLTVPNMDFRSSPERGITGGGRPKRTIKRPARYHD